MKFNEAVKNNVNEAEARTENGMKARATTASKVLDFFSKAGSSRNTVLKTEFFGAYSEDADLTLRALLWTRDVRGGAGERNQFRQLLQELEKVDPKAAANIMHKVPTVGRWDDMLAYKNPINRKTAFDLIEYALRVEGNGLAAKWMPRKGKVAAELRNHMGLSPKAYRKLLVGLTNVVEQKMCSKNWSEIDYSKIPSLAAARYQKAFHRNDAVRYAEYLNKLTSGDTSVKINAGAVYPYDVVKSVRTGLAQAADAQWKALPNFIGDAKILPVVDVSGSMETSVGGNIRAIDVAVSLGLYCSEKNVGDFKDVFLTFSENPSFVTVTGTLSERCSQMNKSEWGFNTNLHLAFEKILQVAKQGKVSQADMPDTVLILSDMQFDNCVYYDDSAVQMIRRKYEDAGYNVPNVVFWNINGDYGRNNTPVRYNDNGVALVSGFSPAIMKAVLSDKLEVFTPYNVMMETLMVERYSY